MNTPQIICPACGHSNPSTATLCGSCQSRLSATGKTNKALPQSHSTNNLKSHVRIMPDYNHGDHSCPPPPSDRAYHIPASQCNDVKCIHCGNSEVRKLTAILQSETWTSNSHTSTTTQGSTSMGIYTPGRDHRMSFGHGVTTGRSQTVTNSRSNSMLAAGIKPPPKPSLPPTPTPPDFSYSAEEDVVVYLGIGFGGVVLCALLGWPMLVIAIVAGGAYFYDKYRQARQKHEAVMENWRRNEVVTIERWKKSCSDIMYRWEEMMLNWQSLYYCPRCDNVYYPGTNVFTSVVVLNDIL